MNKVIIIGEKNVGKSSLFNIITKKKISTTINYPGYTRDCISSITKLKSKIFEIIDTAGIGYEKTSLDHKTIKNTWEEIKKSDTIVFLMDSITNCSTLNLNILNVIKKFKKNVIYVINKIDLNKSLDTLSIKQYFKIHTLFLISIKKNIGIDILLKEIEKSILDQTKNTINTKNALNLAIIGRPNVGKSSFTNKISNSENIITDNTPGTTRDVIKINACIKENLYKIIDTPGIKKQADIKTNVDKILITNSIKTIKSSNIIILMTDITNKITIQDLSLLNYIRNNYKNVIIAINKTDKIKKQTLNNINYTLKTHIKKYVKYFFISSKYFFGIENIIKEITKIKNFQKRIIKKEEINNLIEKIKTIKKIKIYYNPLTIIIKTEKKNIYNKEQKTHICGIIIKMLDLKSISTKIIFKN